MTRGSKPPSWPGDVSGTLPHSNRRVYSEAVDFALDDDSLPDSRADQDDPGSRAAIQAGGTSSNEILAVVLQSLKQKPDRVDLWIMRFEIQAALGDKSGFVDSMRAAFASKVVRRGIDWALVSRQWQVLAAGEPAPEGVILPSPNGSSAASKDDGAQRRFSDIAPQIAGRELEKLEQDYRSLRAQPGFFTEFARRTKNLLHRPTPIHHAEALCQDCGGGARIFFKREDLRKETPETETAFMHSYLAAALGKRCVITGNDVDEYSIALAGIAPLFNLETAVVVSHEDMEEKKELIERLRSLAAAVEVMSTRDQVGHDPREAALRAWQKKVDHCHLALSYGVGPSPFPTIVGDFQMQLGFEADLQLRAKTGGSRSRCVVAAMHSEADSIGFVLMYLKKPEVRLYYAEPEHSGVQDWKSSHRLRAYNGAQREHAWLRATGRITTSEIADVHAQEMQQKVKSLEGFDIGLEDARAVTLASRLSRTDYFGRDILVLVA